jgi:hypothetical protein
VCAWSTIKGQTIDQLGGITDNVTLADDSYMNTYCYSHIKDIIEQLKINATAEDATAAAADTTPSVAAVGTLHIPQAVTITNFDDGTNGQLLEVVADVANVVITHNNSLIKLPMNLNITLWSAQDYILLKRLSGIWVYRHHQHF